MSADRRPAVLLRTTPLGPLVRGLVFELTEGRALPYRAGQSVEVHLPSDGEAPRKRSYSIATAPNPDFPGRFEIAVTRSAESPSSWAIHALDPGAVVDIEGPRGAFAREGEARERPALFVATGTGLSPLRAMLQAELARGDGPPLSLLFGCRAEADILWGDDLARWATEHPRLRLRVTLSRPGTGWRGLGGRVQAHLGAALPGAGAHAYLCGAPAMVRELRGALTASHGFERASVHTEAHI